MKRHAFDPFPFVLGGLLLTLAVLGLLDTETLAQVRVRILIPAVLVTMGAAMLLGSIGPRANGTGRDAATPPASASVTDELTPGG